MQQPLTKALDEKLVVPGKEGRDGESVAGGAVLSLTNGRRASLLPLLIYMAAAIGLFGLRVLPHLSTNYFGLWRDPGLFIWCLEWWPWAILHGHNPLYCRLLWAPVGADLTWMTSIPGLSVLAAPVTLTIGPMAAYNLLAVAGPALSAWTAYIVCRHITGASWPSLFGGWIYGFSTYESNHAVWGHLFLSWALVPPLLLYLVLQFVQSEIGSRRLVFYLAAALVAQFSISVEVFATATLFGGLAILLGALLMPEFKPQLYKATLLIIGAYALTAIAVSPFLYHFFFLHGVSREPIFPPAFFSNDLLSALVPGPLNFVSRASHQLAIGSENEAYLGPLLALILWFAFTSWNRAQAKLLVLLFGLIYLASMGPRLYILGHSTIPLPWILITSYVPVFNNALPARFILFAWLITAIVSTMLLARNDTAVSIRLALALVCIVFLLPNPRYLQQAQNETFEPRFFSQQIYRRYLKPDENILIIPYSYRGESMLWQAQAHMDFRMAEGWTGAAPPEVLRWPIVNSFLTGAYTPDYSDQFKAFLSRYNIQAVVVCDNTATAGTKPLSTLGVRPLEAGDVKLYPVPEPVLRAYRHANVGQMERKAAAAWFARLIAAGDKYVAAGFEIRALTPKKAADLGLLPQEQWAQSLDDIEIRRRMGGPSLWLGAYHGDAVAIALVGSSEAVRPLMSRYASDAAAVYFPYPRKFTDALWYSDAPEILLMVFTRQGLAQAASKPVGQTKG